MLRPICWTTILTDAALDQDCQVRRYSGRGMSGKECLGIYIQGLASVKRYRLIAAICRALSDHCSDEDLPEATGALEKLLDGTQDDSLGTGIIMYWPSIPVTEMDIEDDKEGR
jgi:hypothetical protein